MGGGRPPAHTRGSTRAPSQPPGGGGPGQVDPKELCVKLMDAAVAKGAELRFVLPLRLELVAYAFGHMLLHA